MQVKSAISCDMPARDDGREATIPSGQKVGVAYGKLLDEARRRRGLTLAQWAERAEIHESTASRVAAGEGSVKAARALRKVLVELGETIPPVTFDEGAAPDWLAEWTAIGEELRKVKPEEFRKTVRQLRSYLAALRVADRGIQLIVDPLPFNPDDDE